MHTISTTCEIYESPDEKDFRDGIGGAPKYDSKFSTEDDINRLFESITSRNMGFLLEGTDSSARNPSKRPITASRIGITEPVSLKQALRGMCISQASEMAATKRFSKPGNHLASSDAFTTRQLYGAVVIEANQIGLPLDICKGSAVEVSDSAVEVDSTQKISRVENLQNEFLNSYDLVASPKEMTRRNPSPCDAVTPVRMDLPGEKLDSDATEEAPGDLAQMELSRASSTVSNLTSVNRGKRTVFNASYLLGPIRRKGFVKKKSRQESSASNSSSPCSPNPRFDSDGYGGFNECRSNHKSEDAWTDGVRANVDNLDPGKHCGTSSNCGIGTRFLVRKADREKGEFSHSSKSSVGDFSCSTSSSEMSNISRLWRSGTRPHMSKDSRWEAIRSVQMPNGGMNLRNLKLLKRLGSGDIGTVYLAELTGTNCWFALKVMDLEFLGARRKLTRAETEKSIMQMLDHPFLPTLYAHISTEKLSCLVMDYCPGGDLHVLRQKQPMRSFSEQAARFYVAEVLLALEYLHMLGVIYRDLKPENVLIREDGHIMLLDFDLSLRCSVTPTVITSSPESEQTTRMSTPCNDSSCMEPFCLNPSFHLRCFTQRLLSIPTRSQKSKPDLSSQIIPMQQIVVEPTNARSNSFVGTHEYLAPEIIKGEGHGSAVDWWTFGIFLYELLFGKTPFKGSSNEETLANVISRRLLFPDTRVVSHQAKDLIRELLTKNPDNRLGSVKGAAEIKWHAFFKGLNWALIRCAVPPEHPKGPFDMSEVGDGSLEAEMQMGFEVF